MLGRILTVQMNILPRLLFLFQMILIPAEDQCISLNSLFKAEFSSTTICRSDPRVQQQIRGNSVM